MTLDIVPAGVHGKGVVASGVRGPGHGHGWVVSGSGDHLRLWRREELEECLPQLLDLRRGVKK